MTKNACGFPFFTHVQANSIGIVPNCYRTGFGKTQLKLEQTQENNKISSQNIAKITF